MRTGFAVGYSEAMTERFTIVRLGHRGDGIAEGRDGPIYVPFALPGDVKAGDWIEIGMLGAYGAAMKTAFNGFGESVVHEAADEPMASQYTGERRVRPAADNVVSLR